MVLTKKSVVRIENFPSLSCNQNYKDTPQMYNDTPYQFIRKRKPRFGHHVKVTKVVKLNDSRLVVSQINREYEAKEDQMIEYLSYIKNLIRSFQKVQVIRISREDNMKANKLFKLVLSATLELGRTIYINILNEPNI